MQMSRVRWMRSVYPRERTTGPWSFLEGLRTTATAPIAIAVAACRRSALVARVLRRTCRWVLDTDLSWSKRAGQGG